MKIMSKLTKKLNKIDYYEEKKRLLLVFIVFLGIIFLIGKLFQTAYAAYESTAKINANIEKALYILKEGELSFNIDPNQIIPSNKPYVYKFSVSNFDEKNTSDMDIEYSITLQTTTNLPLTFKLYRNELHDDPAATNKIDSVTTIQDVDGAWYNLAPVKEKYTLLYTQKTTDIYTLVINFPNEYKTDEKYADNIENIIIELNSKQVIQ